MIKSPIAQQIENVLSEVKIKTYVFYCPVLNRLVETTQPTFSGLCSFMYEYGLIFGLDLVYLGEL